jgi:hypothetical protein
MQHGTTPLPCKVNDGRAHRSGATLRLVWPTAFLLLLLATPIIFYVWVHAYLENKWGALRPGMTRVQVDRELGAFRSYPSQYSGLGPGQFVIRYELLGMGKLTMIQVIYDPDGTVYDAQPIFDI